METAGGAADAAVRGALAAVAAGRPVVVVDDEDRENEGDLVLAAECATPELMTFVVRHTSGFVCVALPGAECDRLSLPPMSRSSADRFGTAYTVTVDAVSGTTTGISAADRATTARVLADPASGARDLRRPGHVVGLRARDGGVLRRRGHTEAAVDLARLAGRRPAGVLCEIVRPDGEMARRPELAAFAAEHGLDLITIGQLAAYRRRTERLVERVTSTRLPTGHGEFTAVGYRDLLTGGEHVALVAGDVAGRPDVPVHVHAECLCGDVLGSLRCPCRAELQAALAAVSRAGRGVLVYVRAPERAGGLLDTLRAYEVQDAGQVGQLRAHRPGRAGAAEDGPGVADAVLADLGVRSTRPTVAAADGAAS
jgi:3,4-dihydroxy 2-butanone 4-phosphate synthase/GTP cyclohydrolase II